MTSLLGAFNNHFLEFIEDLIIIFPHDSEIKTLKTAFSTLKSVNPKAVVKIWSKYILKYRELEKIRSRTTPCPTKNLKTPRKCYFESNYRCSWNENAKRCDLK